MLTGGALEVVWVLGWWLGVGW
ncbi:hypothetical protein E2C01_092390 [Portunus trituberculatus]|uniref:Uncharacterized protein n=1 Tax=Portunus trituberculatus TaxID=210409 RepID=A0A5B7JVN8_PORTR|nr:hypothetical protein [Portunus trituberculatus]